jgi:hypothetical protein
VTLTQGHWAGSHERRAAGTRVATTRSSLAAAGGGRVAGAGTQAAPRKDGPGRQGRRRRLLGRAVEEEELWRARCSAGC